MDEVKRLLDEEIKTQFEDLASFSNGSTEKARAVESIETLYRLRIEENKDNQLVDRILRYTFEGLGLVLPLVFYGRWMKRGLEFEKTGTFTSKTFQGLTRMFKPTRKS